ncbi:hypothetical protein GKG47_17775 [Lactonifactor sp. BIOML-A3]|nr:hypothetical protein [Lactonifactor sp. BIOML-A5]MSA09734.1 hypothetical protein [Lactonifactor sp. BIOML-A4]MSA14276.1 hypothetical protein [Lactonifactor sp. BIOML-A3]MSA18739.1 hypothetical protein [Lactonifactor sp. BIOML-A2]MSA39521.1 hypothetical protein [Lactonifactor sp. BIOML-A1]MSB15308.1 hypothetical protein [Lactonifactor sp. BIOML-A6]MSB70847.1 hypothetical protein [Lactonifactor sp. BIOML-A7]
MLKRAGILAAVIALVILVITLVIQKRVYHKYSVLFSLTEEDTSSKNYVDLDGAVLKYGNDGAALLDSKQNVVWNQTYEMQDPQVDICGETAVVADKKGTAMYIFSKDGPSGAVDSSLPILKAKVASQGVVAAILEDGEKTWINFYASDGTVIAENQTRIDSPGYPVDLAVSPNGQLIMVTYLYVENGVSTSYVAYYNFGNAGQNEIDNIVSGYTYEGILVPQVAYLDESTSLAFRDNGFTIYKGKQIPKEATKVDVKKEIVSTFYDDSHVGLIFKSDNKSKQYTMRLYSTSGRLLFERDFNIEYKNVKLSDGMVIMNNENQVCLMSLKGVEKFNGTIDEGNIKDIFKVGMNKYMLVTDKGSSTIKFK